MKTIIVLTLVLSTFIFPGQTQQNSGFFWHIADMHWDPTYRTDEQALSCNPDTVPNTTFGIYGDFKCDAPWDLINSSVQAMRTIKANVDFLIWTGDDTPHIYNDTILNKQAVADIISKETDILQEVFHDKIVYSALGNHDWSPKHQLPPVPDPLYEFIAGKWAPWMDAAANVTFKEAGYYTMLLKPGIRMVMLNTNLYYTNNEVTEEMPDPGNQLQWLDDLLTLVAANNETVMIVGHVPPGMFEKHFNKSWYYPYHNEVFVAMLEKHAGVIGGIYMAHHHTDTFRIVYDSMGEPVSSIFIGPAVTPWETTLPDVMGGKGNNPSIRLIEYDRDTGHIKNIIQYYLNLTEANTKKNDMWHLEYNAKGYFGIPDLSPASLDDLVEQMRKDDAQFDKYYKANGVLYDPNEKWDEETRKVHLCAITNLDYMDYYNCVDPPQTAAGISTRYSQTVLWFALALAFYLVCLSSKV